LVSIPFHFNFRAVFILVIAYISIILTISKKSLLSFCTPKFIFASIDRKLKHGQTRKHTLQ